MDEFLLNVKTFFTVLESRLGTHGIPEFIPPIFTLFNTGSLGPLLFAGQSTESDQRVKFVGLVGLFVFHSMLFRPPVDRKFFKQLWDCHKSVPIICPYANVAFFAPEFLGRKLPHLVKTLGKTDVQITRKEYLKTLDDGLAKCISYTPPSLVFSNVGSNWWSSYFTVL
jgi:hypothetical protein